MKKEKSHYEYFTTSLGVVISYYIETALIKTDILNSWNAIAVDPYKDIIVFRRWTGGEQ